MADWLSFFGHQKVPDNLTEPQCWSQTGAQEEISRSDEHMYLLPHRLIILEPPPAKDHVGLVNYLKERTHPISC